MELGVTKPGATGTSAEQLPAIKGRTSIDNVKASTLIMDLCILEVLQHILLLETAKEQWKALRSLYRPLRLQQLSAKVQAFIGYRLQEYTTIAEISTQLNTLQYKIKAIDNKERSSNTLKKFILLQTVRALNDRYSSLILQLKINDQKLKYSTIVVHFAELKRRLRLKKTLEAISLSAVASKKLQSKKSNKNKGQQYIEETLRVFKASVENIER